MDPLASDVARRAASRLAAEFGPNLPAFTERALASADPTVRRRSFDVSTTLALASLVVSVAQFGWQIYRDLSKDREADQRRTVQMLARRMRLSLTEPSGLDLQQQDRLLEVVAEEIVASCPPD
jgi:hypothetical protein